MIKIAIPKERRPGEKRVAASPDTVKKFVALGLEVAVEAGAGDGAAIPDDAFAAAGATMAADARALLGEADLVLRVQGPPAAGEGGVDELAAMKRSSQGAKRGR